MSNKRLSYSIFRRIARTRLLHWMPDDQYLKLAYFFSMGEKLDLTNPKTFNEKLQWLKINDRKPIYTTMADKYRAKAFVDKTIGEGYTVPVYATWNSADDIEISALPDQFVLKTNHDNASVFICTDKSKFDLEKVKRSLAKSLKNNFYYQYREWPYKGIKPLIFAEKYLNMGEALIDYKVMCFMGEPQYIQLNYVSSEKHYQDFYNPKWELLDINQSAYVDSSRCQCEKPAHFEEMIELSRKLAKDTRFLRVDWFISEGKLYSGELTFFDGAGLTPYDDPAVDYEMGSLIKLPSDHL